jgi:hypothetical protein
MGEAPIIDFNILESNTAKLQFHQRRDTGIEFRRLMTLSHLSRALYQPGNKLPPGFKPDIHQLKPMNLLERGWFHDLLRLDNKPIYPRRGLVVGDEGGMGKTLSCVIAALNTLHLHNGTVLILCPPLMKNHWRKMFHSTPHAITNWTGSKIASEIIPKGIILLSKHSLLGHELTDLRKKQLREKIKLIILDEAHEWFIADSDDSGKEGRSARYLRELIHAVISGSTTNQCLLVTATPMRNQPSEFFSLIDLIEPGVKEKFKEKFNEDLKTLKESWITSMGKDWFLLLEKLRVAEPKHVEGIINEITNNMEQFVTLDDEDEYLQLTDALKSKEFIDSLNGEDRVEVRSELIQDLHPLGRYLSVTLRDDLGDDVCKQKYRDMNSKTVAFEMNDEYYDMVDQIIEQIPEPIPGKAKFPIDWKAQFFDCPTNFIGKYHQTKFSKESQKIPKLKAFNDRIKDIWAVDNRLKYVKKLIKSLLVDDPTHKAKGLIIFSRFKNTCHELEQAILTEFEDAVDTYVFLPPPDPLDGTDPPYDSRSNDLKTARKKSLQNEEERLQIIISGPSGSVGLDMEWATHIIHWSTTLSFGMISQRTWRLDRRIDQEEDKAIDMNFFVHHFIEKSKEKSQRKKVNDAYFLARTLLGDRQNLAAPEFQLLPPPSENHLRTWSQTTRVYKPTGIQSTWLWGFICGEEGGLNSISELIGIKSISALTGIDIDIENILLNTGGDSYDGYKPPNAPLGYELQNGNTSLEKIVEYEGITCEHLHLLMRFTDENHELSFLKKCSGGIIDSRPLLNPSGQATMMKEHRATDLLLTPTGELHTFFTEKVRQEYVNATKVSLEEEIITDQGLCINHYPFVHYVEGKENEKIGLHLELVKFLESESGILMRQVLQSKCLSGLVVIASGECKYLTFGQLEEYKDIFELLLQNALQQDYPDEYFPDSNFATKDRELLSKEENDYRKVLDELAEKEEISYEITSAELWNLYKCINPTPKLKFSKEMFLPLIHIHSDENGRIGCSVCGASDYCYDGICYEWGIEIEDGKSGWC